MAMIQRHSDILKMISTAKEVSVQTLSDAFNVSLVTIRSDLRFLEEQNFLIRTRGGASLPAEDNINRRLGINYDRKQRIAIEAASLIQEGDTVLLEAGSCIALLARELNQFHSLNVITNNAFVARQIKETSAVRVILLGGEFQKESESMVGPMIREYLSYYNFTKVFLGMDGFSLEQGAMGRDIDRCEVMAEFATAGQEVIILSDSAKFGVKGIRSFAACDQIDSIVTDQQLEDKFKRAVPEKGISLILA